MLKKRNFLLMATLVLCACSPAKKTFVMDTAMVECGEMLMIGQLTRVDDANQRDEEGRTALMNAVLKGYPYLSSALFNFGANPDLADNKGATPLMVAVLRDSDDILVELLGKHANVNAQREDGWTALMLAAWKDDLDKTEWLIQFHADPNIKNKAGETAYLKAGQVGAEDVMEYLASQGAQRVPIHLNTAPCAGPALLPAQHWALATTALLAQRNGASCQRLGYVPDWQRPQEIDGLRKWWGLHNREELLSTLSTLDDWGQQKKYLALREKLGKSPEMAAMEAKDDEELAKLKFVKLYQASLGSRGVIGFDYCRYIYLASCGVSAGYLSPQEAWDLIMPMAKKIQAAFSSWRDLGVNYLYGRLFWNGHSDSRMDYVFKLLSDKTDRNSPWNQIPWNLDLNGGGSPWGASTADVEPETGYLGMLELSAAAESGCVWAQYEMGNRYREGEVVNQDLVEAEHWFKRAEARNYPWAGWAIKQLKEAK